MPNIKSAIKRMHTSRKKRDLNKAEKSAMKNCVKKTIGLAEEKNQEQAKEMLSKSFSLIDKAAKKNIIHKNNAARKKAKLSVTVQNALAG
jgi:small subunit ribosomal protein S20